MKLKDIYIKLQKTENIFFEYDFKIICEDVLGIKRSMFTMEDDVHQSKVEKITEIVKELEQGKPLAYILGYSNFYGREFRVKEGVLIPRFDSETVVEKFIHEIKKQTKKINTIADICCGTGCLGITTLLELENKLNLLCIDISNDAVKCTSENIKKFNLIENIKITHTDLFEEKLTWQKIDAFISNPPYVKTNDVKNSFEPHLALDGGQDGLLFYRYFFEILRKHKNILFAVFEIGFDLKDDLNRCLVECGFDNFLFTKDLGNNYRTLIVYNS